MTERLWDITEINYSPDKLNHYETLFTVGNGYLGTRGAFEEDYAASMPATMIHGIYDHAPSMQVPELVNAPNWLPINLTIDGTPFRPVTITKDFMKPPEGYLIGYSRTLDLKRAVLTRETLFRAASGAIVRVTFERFASLHDQHLMAQRVTITAVDGAPTITLESAIDANVTNTGVQHFAADMTIVADERLIGVEGKTQQSGYAVAMASCLGGADTFESTALGLRPTTRATFTLKPEETRVFEKITAIVTSRDANAPLSTARDKATTAARLGFGALLAAHEAEWAAYWEVSDIRIDGDEECQRAVRFTTYHILIAAPRHDERVSIGAKTLSGTGYKGHVFWDTELFAAPPVFLTHPAIGRNMLMYRYHNLPGARHKAIANGYEGAMYPWESTDTGEETTPQWSDVQPDGSRIRIWTGDNEQHISTDIAFTIYRYWRWSGDDEFLTKYGAEIVLDTAVFWGSRVEERNDRYEISQQIGPDEYHENIDNSVFVNRLTQWHLTAALAMLDWLRQHAPADADRLTASLKLTPERLDKWRDIIARMYIPFDEKQQIHIQFPGFFDMEYIPVPNYHPRVTSVQAILGHARSIQTQVIKQADVVMLMALLGDEAQAPDPLADHQVKINNWNTYYPRTDHGSSLSPAMHAWVAARLGLNEVAYEMFHHAAHIDLNDNKGNVRDGMHAAACGGVWQAAVFGFGGLHIDSHGEPALAPNLPAHWRELSFCVTFRGEKRRFTIANPVFVSPST